MVCFGAEAAKYRVDLYPRYHADRPPVPDALAWQFDHAPELFDAFGWSTMSTDDLEADDLLGALAPPRQTRADGADHDRRPRHVPVRDRADQRRLPQAALERVRGGRPRRGRARATGSRPGSCPTSSRCAATRRTASQARPGSAPRRPPICSQRHGSLDAAIAAADQERPRVAAALTDAADELRAFRAIATLHRADVELPAGPPDGPRRGRRGGASAGDEPAR